MGWEAEKNGCFDGIRSAWYLGYHSNKRCFCFYEEQELQEEQLEESDPLS